MLKFQIQGERVQTLGPMDTELMRLTKAKSEADAKRQKFFQQQSEEAAKARYSFQ